MIREKLKSAIGRSSGTQRFFSQIVEEIVTATKAKPISESVDPLIGAANPDLNATINKVQKSQPFLTGRPIRRVLFPDEVNFCDNVEFPKMGHISKP